MGGADRGTSARGAPHGLGIAAVPTLTLAAVVGVRADMKAAAVARTHRYVVQVMAAGRVVAATPPVRPHNDWRLPTAGTLTAGIVCCTTSPPPRLALRLIRLRPWPTRALRVATLALQTSGQEEGSVWPSSLPSTQPAGCCDAVRPRPWREGVWAGSLGAAVCRAE